MFNGKKKIKLLRSSIRKIKIEILTGAKAGERKNDGTFEEETVNYLVDKKLTEFGTEMI